MKPDGNHSIIGIGKHADENDSGKIFYVLVIPDIGCLDNQFLNVKHNLLK